MLSDDVNVTFVSHESVAVASSNDGCAGQSIVVGPGSDAIVGAVSSLIETSCEEVAVFPQSSVAIHVRVTL